MVYLLLTISLAEEVVAAEISLGLFLRQSVREGTLLAECSHSSRKCASLSRGIARVEEWLQEVDALQVGGSGCFLRRGFLQFSSGLQH